MHLLRPGLEIHLVGIGGSGLSGIARVLHGRGFCVSGSDRQRSDMTDALAAEGIKVYIGHDAENLWGEGSGSDSDRLVVVSSAIPDDNPEVVEARRRSIKVVKRHQILAELTADQKTLAVAGTHGKTTTSAMIAWILTEAGLQPSFIVGGVLQNLGCNAHAGKGRHFVIEADEYDRAFLGLSPDVAVVTVIEHDHPDCYPTFEEMKAAFAEFAERAARRDRLIVCGEDPEARRLGARIARQAWRDGPDGLDHVVITYGFGPEWDWQADSVELGACPTFNVRFGGRRLGTCALQLPGRHNVLNALAAIAAAAEVGIEFDVAAAALARFRGTARRFEFKGQVGGVTVVDDYAHHPTEIQATLAAARTKYPGRPLWAVFQPHTFSRTAALLDRFAAAFDEADHVLVTRIYAAREEDTYGVTGADIVARMHREVGRDRVVMLHPDAEYVDTLEGVVARLLDRLEPGDVVITLGAGDGYLVGEKVLDTLRRDEARNGRL